VARFGSGLLKRRGLTGLAVGVCLSVAVLTWLGFRALSEWRRSSVQLLQGRADEAARLFVTALVRDMHAVQQSALLSGSWNEYMDDRSHLLGDVVASTFARYPYPESIFTWREGDAPADVRFLTRSDRRPNWLGPDHGTSRFPVTELSDRPFAKLIAARIQADVNRERRFSIFQIRIADNDYQVIARVYYRDQYREAAQGAIGFTVNLPWVRRFYFPELTRQISRLGEVSSSLAMSILDAHDGLVASTKSSAAGAVGATTRRSFEPVFFDPRIVLIDRPPDLPSEAWTLEVSAYPDPPLATAIRGANRTLIIAALAAVSVAFGLVLTVRAVRLGASLTELRSDLVSTVTHELKTPIATIRAIGDSLLSGRIGDSNAQREYALLVVQEAKQLTRLVDNLLAMASVTDVAEVYSFEILSVAEVVDSALRGFRQQIQDAGFHVRVDVPRHLPRVLADRTAIQLVLDNIVHNAIRYSDQVRSIHVAAVLVDHAVRIEVTDHGRGIPEDEIDKVTRKFFRGRPTVTGGSGLGLAIVQRIVADHRGRLEIRSVVNVGTTVAVHLPVVRGDDEEAHTPS
jgi:signal transduction histidine kinase